MRNAFYHQYERYGAGAVQLPRPPSDGCGGGALINGNGTLYGTTGSSGSYFNWGTVFSISTTVTERVLHSFNNNGSDGIYPGDLIDVKGTLYGTTGEGGAYGYGGSVDGYGTVFALGL
jgi:uncharacterized repeat protein (TIGR03803 family)